ncbi:MAG TPA: kynureninase [Solirubrobacteraceae bacterium]|nr:kynureninase [Solirubrobacteraceae bacterium]
MATAEPPRAAPGRARALAHDDADPLRAFHERFLVAGDGLIYLDGNSLGRLPRDTAARVTEVVWKQWGERLIRGWSEGWMELPHTIGDRLGAALLGAGPGQVVVADSTTVCFYKLAAAAIRARPGRTEIITDVDNFPTDRYVLESLAAEHGMTIRWIEADPHAGPEPEQVAQLLSDRTALVTFSQVNYRSAFILDARAITAVAHDAGALALWDLSHSAGAIPVALDDDGIDLAVGCTYKYLNGGPGAPAFLYVRREHQAQLRQPVWGWLGRRDPFEMAAGYLPGDGIDAMLSGTPPVLGLTAAQVGIDLVIEAGIDAIREKSVALTDYCIELIDEWLAPLGCTVGSPRDAARRGSHVALVHPGARALTQRLIDAGVVPDFRTPDVIRLGLSPLTTRFADVYDGLSRLAEMLVGGQT